MPVAREPIATEALQQAEDVDCGRLLLERPLGMHDAWACLREFNTIDMTRGVAAHIADAGRLVGQSCSELQHDARCDIT